MGESEKKEELDKREKEEEEVLEKEKDRQIEEQEEREKGGLKRQMLTRMKDLKMILRHFMLRQLLLMTHHPFSQFQHTSCLLVFQSTTILPTDIWLTRQIDFVLKKSFSCMNLTLCHPRVFKQRFHVLESKTFWPTDF